MPGHRERHQGNGNTRPGRDGDIDESRRIIERINAEMEPGGLAAGGHAVDRARRHFSGGDADPEDRIEVVGRRIGRALSLVLFIVLSIWLIRFFLNGGLYAP